MSIVVLNNWRIPSFTCPECRKKQSFRLTKYEYEHLRDVELECFKCGTTFKVLRRRQEPTELKHVCPEEKETCDNPTPCEECLEESTRQDPQKSS